MIDPTPLTLDGPAAAHRLQCMEIWGGHGETHDAVSTRGMDAWVFSRPYDGNDRGGDIHYLSACASGRILRVALADVAGHGERVSGVARSLRGLMRKHINTPDQSRLARGLNRAFSEGSSEGLFATAVIGSYWSPDRTFVFVNAGHPRPLLSRGGGGWVALDGSSPEVVGRREDARGLTNLPLGVLADSGYEQLAVGLEVGDRVLLYTDFAIEARSSAGTELGEAGVIALLDGLDVEDSELIGGLLEGVSRHTGGAAMEDDASVVLLRHTGAGMPHQSLGDRARTLARLIGLASV